MMGERSVLVFENAYKLTNYLLKLWTGCAREAITHRGKFTAALSGGNTPLEFYCRLASVGDFTQWSDTYLFQVDERFVPLAHADNNFRLINEQLISQVAIPKENVFRIMTETGTARECAQQYDQTLRTFFQVEEHFPSLDLVILGLGEDGHTASLFPSNQALIEKKACVTDVVSAQLHHKRITLTYPVLNNARCVVFVVTGEKKAAMIKNVLELRKDYPATKVKAQEYLIFLLDAHAAGKLSVDQNYIHYGDAISIKLPY